jgi:hypothetical protein
MNKVLSVGLALVVMSFAGLTFVGAASAQGPVVASASRPQSALGNMWGNFRLGFGALSDVITALLGLTEDELHVEREAGKTFAEIASEQGVDAQAIVDAMVAAQRELIEQALGDGQLTEAQAQALIARAETMAALRVNKPAGAPVLAEQVRGMMGRFGRQEVRGE